MGSFCHGAVSFLRGKVRANKHAEVLYNGASDRHFSASTIKSATVLKAISILKFVYTHTEKENKNQVH